MQKMQGFSFKELFITLSVLVLFGLLAYPAYQNFSRRLVYADILKSTEPYKLSIVECYKKNKGLKECDSGKNQIAKNIFEIGPIESLTVTVGIITVIPKEQSGILHSDNYILTPIVKDGELQWIASGKAITNAYAS